MIGVLAQASTTDFDIFVQTFFKAAALGSLYSLLALGFVLVKLEAGKAGDPVDLFFGYPHERAN